MKTPFLWSFVSNVPESKSQSGGQEGQKTASIAEENIQALTKFD